jgi:PHD/YefM family antitoxin component YafN of YafNO toxin-antitoxin module
MVDVGTDLEPSPTVVGRASQLIRQLQAADEPIVLTVNGHAKLVVHDARSTEKLLELVDRLEAIEAIREGLEDEAAGRLVSLEEAIEMARRKHGIPL